MQPLDTLSYNICVNSSVGLMAEECFSTPNISIVIKSGSTVYLEIPYMLDGNPVNDDEVYYSGLNVANECGNDCKHLLRIINTLYFCICYDYL